MRTLSSTKLAAIVCLLAGVLISALPHFIACTRSGRPDFVSSGDERFFLAMGSQAYFNHPYKLADPVRAVGGQSLFRPLPILPGVWAAKLLGLGPMGIGLMWRVLAGASIGLGWYALFRLKVKRPWVAASMALVLLSDPGLTDGFPFRHLADRAISIATESSDSTRYGWVYFFYGWRVVSPATMMLYLMALIWAVVWACEAPSRRRIAVAGLTFGLLFYVYFYYWTAAALALLLAMALDAGNRRVYFHIGWIGGLIGLPIVISDALLKQRMPSVSDWLVRCGRFVPIGRFSELTLPKEALVVMTLGLVWVLIRRRDLIFIWAVGAAGLLLANHQILTRLQIENFHWKYVWGPGFSYFVLLTALEVGDRLNWSYRAIAAIGTTAVVAYCVGLWIRGVEATRCNQAVMSAQAIAAYRADFPPIGSSKFVPNAVAAGEFDFVDFAAIIDNLRPLSNWSVYYSASVTDAEMDDRAALNDLLLGVDRTTFEAKQPVYFKKTGMGPWSRDPSLIPSLVAVRVAAYDHARADLAAALDRFGVRYVALRAGTKPDYLAHGWTVILTGSTWDVWERVASGPLPPRSSVPVHVIGSSDPRQSKARFVEPPVPMAPIE